jgi:predicted dehydrogenase
MICAGIIGLGYWGPNLLRAFSESKDCKVKYACDLLDNNIAKLRNKYHSVTFTKNYTDLLKDKEVDIICIATPPETHFKIAYQAIEAGKHVLIEKPMTTRSEDAQKLIALAAKKKKLIFVDHTFCFSPPVIKIKELLGIKEIGEPLYFDSERINLGLIQEKVNVVWDLAVHDFSILTFLFPELKPTEVIAIGSKHVQKKNEEMAHIMIKFNTPFVGHIHVSWLSPVKMRQTIIGGNRKMIMYDDTSVFEKIKIYEKGVDVNFSEETSFKPIYRSGDIIIPKLTDDEPLANEVKHIVSCIEKKEKPRVDGLAGLAVVKLLEACDESMKNNRGVKL